LYRVMTRPPRRAYDHDGNEIAPMSLGNMREHGVRSVLALCQEASCGHSDSMNVGQAAGWFPGARRVLAPAGSACGSRNGGGPLPTVPDNGLALLVVSPQGHDAAGWVVDQAKGEAAVRIASDLMSAIESDGALTRAGKPGGPLYGPAHPGRELHRAAG